jgi:hypothetical protein
MHPGHISFVGPPSEGSAVSPGFFNCLSGGRNAEAPDVTAGAAEEAEAGERRAEYGARSIR